MGNQPKKIFAYAQKYGVLQGVYWTDIGFGQPGRQSQGMEFIKGLWDTGCSITSISKRVADKLALPVVGKVNSNTAGGIIECDRHIVNAYLPNRVCITNLIIMSNPKLTVDCLIGTDIISQGDFSVSNYEGKTIVSFRMPSHADIDYVQWAKNADPAKKAPSQDRNNKCSCGSGKKFKNCCQNM